MKELKLKLITVLLIMVLMLITSVAVFGATGSLTVRWVPDVSNAIEGKEVKVTLSITDFSNVDTSLPLIGSATLQYDTSIFSSIIPTVFSFFMLILCYSMIILLIL